MSKQKLLGPIAGFVMVLLLSGALFAPTIQANAQESDNEGKGKNKGNSYQGDNEGKGNGNHGNNVNANYNVNNNNNKNVEKEDDNSNHCKKHKYNGVCDKTKPSISISSINDVNGGGTQTITIMGTATDTGSGIKKVTCGKNLVSTTSGPFTCVLTFPDTHGHSIKITATDKANNIARKTVHVHI